MSATAPSGDRDEYDEAIDRFARIVRDRVDPTETLTRRRQYESDILRRYRQVGDEAVRLVRAVDAWGQTDPFELNTPSPSKGRVPSTPPPPGYDWPQSPSGLARFLRWVEDALSTVVLGDGAGGPDAQGWSDEYIRYAYFKGMVHAEKGLAAAGYGFDEVEVMDTFNIPIHRDTLEIFYRRQYRLLEDVNSTQSKEIQRILADGFLAGENPNKTARTLRDNIDSVSLRRGRVIARTEMIHAHAEGTLNRLERALGPTAKVGALVEFTTAGDDRVCEQCLSLEGKVYAIKDARGILPVHPNCRCVWVPIVT